MKREWEAHTRLSDGFCRVVFEDGEEITVSNDGVSGFPFVEEYLKEMREHYPSHLEAADQILRRRLGKAYKTVCGVRPRYMAELALVSLNCCFGREDNVPDHTEEGDFNPEKTLCPERYCCPFNGFREENKGSRRVCCNPVYECGLTRTQAEVADMLANTPMDYKQIAEKLGVSYSAVDNIRKRVLAATGAHNRPELTYLLRGKRLV